MHNKESAATRAAHRRQLTVLFSDLSDSTALTRLLHPEEYAEVLTALRECFEQVIPRHGGTITQVRGDGILAIFGLDAHEDEARRATEAALDLHAAVQIGRAHV